MYCIISPIFAWYDVTWLLEHIYDAAHTAEKRREPFRSCRQLQILWRALAAQPRAHRDVPASPFSRQMPQHHKQIPLWNLFSWAFFVLWHGSGGRSKSGRCRDKQILPTHSMNQMKTVSYNKPCGLKEKKKISFRDLRDSAGFRIMRNRECANWGNTFVKQVMIQQTLDSSGW